MTSVVDKYYRRIIQNIDNVRMKFDISALLVKSKEHDSKINDIENDISDNLSKIKTNENDISFNLSKIETNETNISSNLSKIETNENDISSNLSKIETNETNISSNLSKIESNETNISSNLSKIETNVSDISKIFELIKNKIPQKTFNRIFDVENKEFKFNRSTHFFEIFSSDIENDFIKDGELRISSKIDYKHKNLSIDIKR